MEIRPVAYFHSPLKSKFGIPRQSGLVSQLKGHIVLEPPFRQAEAVRGLDGFDYLWLIWEFSANRAGSGSLTVRPPRLGGNRRVGVFASRSPFRPNPLGLSCVRMESIEYSAHLGPVIHVLGADLMDGTPIYDIKPYVPYADAHADARSGFVGLTEWHPLPVVIPDAVASQLPPDSIDALKAILEQDPRPQYHDDGERVYGMRFLDYDVRFRVVDGILMVVGLGN